MKLVAVKSMSENSFITKKSIDFVRYICYIYIYIYIRIIK